MATTAKILGQAKPAADTDTDLYTVPGATNTVVSLFICNQGSSTEKYRVALRIGGAGLGATQYIAYDATIAPNGFTQVSGIAMNATDVLTARSDLGDLSFSVVGLETA